MQSSFTLGQLEVTATAIGLPNGLTVDSLTIDATDVRVAEEGTDFGGTAHAEAILTPASVQVFLAARVPEAVQDVRVAFEGGVLVVRARVTLLVTLDVTIRVELVLEQATRLVANVVSVEPGLARGLIEAEIAKANPLLDASELPVPLRLDSVSVEPDAVVLSASAHAD